MSFAALRHNLTTILSYWEQYVLVCCWQLGETIPEGFSPIMGFKNGKTHMSVKLAIWDLYFSGTYNRAYMVDEVIFRTAELCVPV